MSFIQTTCIGNLGRDAVVNNANGRNVINFPLCVNQSWKDSAGVKHEKSLWIDCAMWRESTGVAQYLKKGTQVFVTGEPNVKTYQANDGQTRAQFSLRVVNLVLLGGNGAKTNQPENQPQYQATSVTENHIGQDPGDLPF